MLKEALGPRDAASSTQELHGLCARERDDHFELEVASIISAQGPLVRTCNLAPTWKGEDAQDTTREPGKMNTSSLYNSWVPLKDWISEI